MPLHRSLLDTRSLSADDVLSIFSQADRFSSASDRWGTYYDPTTNSARVPKTVGLLFFEPSTRTRMSFQSAAYKLGHHVLTMELSAGSSLTKGESFADTVLNVAAMGPDALVIRYSENVELDQLLPDFHIPVLNAGSGTNSHPTQALLDAYTILKERGSIRGQRVLIVGDIKHSRVARSNFDVLGKLGAEIGICGPPSFMPEAKDIPGVKIFDKLDDKTLAWATVYMGLRIQLERHTMEAASIDSVADYNGRFGLTVERLKKLSDSAMIMHPGPINHGVEFSPEVMRDPRSRILKQVANGVLIRAALLHRVLEAEKGGK